MKNSYLNGRVYVAIGDITSYSGDAVVNAANPTLYGGGGVDGAIHRAGGSRILKECRKIRETIFPGGVPAGEAVTTTAGDLKCKRVIHTVGPVWYGGFKGEAEILAMAYRNCLLAAKSEELASVAFPSISTGVYGFPKEEAAAIVFRTIQEHLAEHSLPERVDLVFFSTRDSRIFIAVAEEKSMQRNVP